MRAWGVRLVACWAAVGATLALVHPANAGSLSGDDPAADVRFYDLSQGVEAAVPGSRVHERSNGDLKRFSVRHGAKRIRVVLKFRDLKRAEPVIMARARFRFPDGGQLNYAEAVVTATEANTSGTARMPTTDCPVKHRIRYAKNRVELSFPAACFSSPRWIQFNAWILAMDHKKKPSYFYGDDIFRMMSTDIRGVERYTRRIRRS